MNTILHKHKNIDIVRPVGDLVSRNAPFLNKKLQTLIRGGQKKIIVDLSGVDFMDARGLSILVRGCEKVRASGGDLVLLKPSPPLTTLFSITRLDGMFRIVNDESTAIDSLH